MVIEGSSDIIIRCEYLADNDTQQLTFRNGFVLVLQAFVMALYKDTQSIADPLGNGLKALVDIPQKEGLQLEAQGFVSEYSAGFVGLMDEKAILITPNDIQLFPSKLDALHNQNEIVRLALA
ncbi:hypothetical protein NBRC116188_09730 [Oceaniserpentilla sp. 4NH20-0058]|uniref:hypothetical protein n=1 Tax=Oceaniserpentilla sp. 4NH20-0058 TaxID=3127660 RepID=UPI003104F3E9